MARSGFYIFILLLSCSGLYGQDSTKSYIRPAIRTITKEFVAADLQYRDLDTNSNRLELYHPLRRNNIVYQDLGNIGLSARSLHFTSEREAGFNYGYIPHAAYFIDPLQTRYINTRTPYTDIIAMQGGKELLMFKLRHAQNILPRWNAGIDLNRITSEGFLLRQYSSVWGVNVFTHYTTRYKRYVLLGNLTFNSGLNDESGGIKYDSSYEKLTGGEKQVFTNLNNSETHFRNRQIYAQQFLRFGTARYLSSLHDSVYDFSSRSQMVHTIHASEVSYAFYNKGDVDPLLLPNRYYDTTSNTYDSIYYGKLSNSLAYQHLSTLPSFRFLGIRNDSLRTLLSTGLTYDLMNTAQPVFIRQYNNILLEGKFEMTSLRTFTSILSTEAAYVASGYNQGDYKLKLQTLLTYNAFSILLYVRLQQALSDYTTLIYKSNPFIWNNAFEPVRTRQFKVGLMSNRWRNNFRLTGGIQQLENWVYFNSNALPAQLASAANVYTAELQKTFAMGRLRFEHHLMWQKSTTDSIRLPEFSGFIRYYYQARFFGISKLQIGFNVFYNTAYKSDAYNPSSRQFYLQQDVRTGNYPVFNPFLITDIKRASIFLTYEHLNMDWFKSGMYYTAHYPVELSSMRMGIRWRFYD